MRAVHLVRAYGREDRGDFLLLVFGFLGGIMVVNLIVVFEDHECDSLMAN